MTIFGLIIVIAVFAFWLGRASARNKPKDIGVGPQPSRRSINAVQSSPELTRKFAALAPATRSEIDRMLHAGQKIHAIKLAHDNGNLRLKEAKDVIEARERALGL